MSIRGFGIIGAIFGISDALDTHKKAKLHQSEAQKAVKQMNDSFAELERLRTKDYMGEINRDKVTLATTFLEVSRISPNKFCLSWKINPLYDNLTKGYEIYRNYLNKASQKVTTISFIDQKYSYEYIDTLATDNDIPVSYSVYIFCEFQGIIYRSTRCIGGDIADVHNIQSHATKPQLQIKTLESGAIRLYWNRKNVVEKYELYRKSSCENSFSCIATLPCNSHRYTDEKVQSDTEYVYQLKAIISNDYGITSELLSKPLKITPLSSKSKCTFTTTNEHPTNNKYTNIDFDSMNGHQFESFCTKLLTENGFRDVQKTKGSGDQGIDILAKKGQVKYGFQCKCYSSKVGNKAVQEVFSGKAYYNLHVGVVLTNNYFTTSAIQLAEKNGILLWNRQKLLSLISNK